MATKERVTASALGRWQDEPLEEVIPAGKLENLRAYYPNRRLDTLGDAAQMTDAELLRPKACGRKTLNAIKDAISHGRYCAQEPFMPMGADPLLEFDPHIRYAAWDITGKLVGSIVAFGNDYSPVARKVAEGLRKFETDSRRSVPKGKAIMLVDISHQSGGTQ